MRKFLFLFFLLFSGLVFSQTKPISVDISAAHFKDTNGLIHLVGSDAEFNTLTYTIVTLPSHGTLKDPNNSDAVVSAGGSLTGNSVTFVPHSDENHKYIFSGTNSFTYKVTDSDGDSDIKTVTVKVFDSYLNPPTLIGAEINGDAAEDSFGRSVSLSEDGTIMAVGAPFNDDNGAEAGHVKVFKFNGTAWEQIGSDIDGINGDNSGSSVSLSADGTILAIGLPYNQTNIGQVRIFNYNGSDWVAMGVITPENIDSGSNKKVSKQFGNDVRLSSDGKTLVVSDIWFSRSGGTSAGRVVAYRYDGTNWNSMGSETALYGASNDNFSWGISLSANGNIMAVGAHENDTPKNNSGEVKIYEYNSGSSVWDVKATLNGVETFDKFGSAVDLSSDGLTVAVGAPYHRVGGSGDFVGKVSVFKWDGSNYVALGSDLIGSDKYDFFGAHLSLDNEGNTLAVMGPGRDATSGSTYLNKGRVRVYNYDGSNWVQSPSSYDFDGEADGDQSAGSLNESKGQRVFLSGDGSVLAIGADLNDGSATDSGHVRVYKLFEPQIIPVAASQTVGFILYEQVDSEDITLSGTDGDSGPSDLVYIITELNTARLIEGGTSIVASDIPHTLAGKVVKYNSNSDVVVNDTFKFIVHDGKASSVPATVTLTVTPDNDAPVATSQSVTTDEDVAIDAITLAATDVDSPQVDLIYIIETLPAKGTLKEGGTAITAAGTILTAKDIIYTPNSNYSGADSFTFKVKDKGVGSDGVTDVETSVSAATVDITVNNTDNDPPISENQSLSVAEETETGTITLVAADPDDDDSSLTYTIATLPSNGTLKDGGTVITAAGDLSGALTYTPNTDFVGNDTFTFTAKDDEAAVSNAATVTISVSNANDPPVSQDQTLTTNEETETGTITLVATDPDDDDSSLTYTIATLPSSGTLKDGGTVITAAGDLSGALTYTPNIDYNGDDTFTFTAKDDEAAVSNAATVTISVTDVNDPPVAQSQSVTTREDTTTNPVITLVATDPDLTDTSFTYTISILPTKGVLKDGSKEITALGTDLDGATLTYTPNSNYNGNDTFKFTAKDDESVVSIAAATVTLTVTPWNDPPVANPQDLTTDEDVPLSITVTGTDIDEDVLTYILYSLPTNGILKQGETTIIAADIPKTLSLTDFTYVPNSKYTGPDSFKFKVRDLTSDTFASTNNLILINNGGTNVSYETENGKTYYLIQNTATKMDWPDAKDLTDSFYGAQMFVPVNKSVDQSVYDALNSMGRLDGPFWYGLYQDKTASDWTNAKEPGGGWVWVDGVKLGSTERPYTNWHTGEPNNGGGVEDYAQFNRFLGGFTWNDMRVGNGQSYALFEFTAEDSTAEIKITVSEFNDPPTANDQSVSAVEQTPITITLTGSDSETANLIYIISTLAGEGTLSNNNTIINAADLPKSLGNGNQVVYTGTSETPSPDSFTFKVKDEGDKQSTAATVSITVGATNDPPEATPQPVETDEDTPKEITHAGTDADGDSLTYIIATLPSKGTLKDGETEIASADLPKTLSSAKATYTPEDNYNGADSYTFKAYDGTAESSAATVDITIKAVNDPPTANNQNLKTDEDIALEIKLTGSDPEDDPLTYIVKTLPTNGVLKDGGNIILASELPKLLPAESLTYVPNADFIGNDSFNFIINANFLNSFTKANGLKYITQDGVPVTYQKPEGKTYFLIQNETGQSGFNPVDWPVAKTLTESIGGAGMYIILNAEMSALVMNGLNDMGIGKGTSNLYWLGLYQDKTSSDYAEPGRENQNWGGWTWTDGVTLKDRGYHNWMPGEPNEAGPEDYGQMNWAQNGDQWNDMRLGAGQSWPLFEFSINEDTDSNTATISIEVESINDPPVANAQTITINEDAVDAAITLTGTDSESQPLTYIIDALPNKGILKEGGTAIATADLPKTLTGNALTYSPNADYYGNDALTFKVNDGVHESGSAIVSIVVNPVNDPPEADPQTVNTDEDVPVDITHVGRDKDLVNIFTIHTQMGADINLGSNWAEYLEISADGETMVVGGWTNNKVKVLSWDGTAWNQLGSDIDGSASGDTFGEFVSISSDGKRIAVGAHKHDSGRGHVRAFDWDGTSWTEAGSEMEGNATGDDLSFRGVHISGDGNVIAAASFKQGYVYTYKWDGTNWDKTGLIPIDKSIGSGAPGQVSLSSDGARLAIGNAASSSNQGQVKIFDWDGTNTWNQYAAIDGNSGDKFGNTLSISRDGKKIAVGVNGVGSARVYDLSGSSATQVGTDISYGSNAAWRAISLSDDGNRVAIPVYSQKTGVFDWDGTNWKQLGEDLVATSDEGESLDMSSDGKTLAIGGHSGLIKVFNILNLTYIITSLPSNGILKEGTKTITASDLPFTLKGTDATYVPNAGFYGNDKYNFKLNDGKADSTDKVSGLREDSQVTIIIKEFVLVLPNNYKITPTETCKGSDFGILDIEVAATSYKKTAAGPDIPITYKISIEGKGELATIVSPNKTAQIKDLPAGKHKLIFKVVQEPKYEEIIVVEITASDPPVAYAVAKLEVCDDAVDQDDSNGKVNFDTSAILNTLLKNPSTGVVQDEKLFDIEFTYFDQATSANVTKATLPNPLYSASQTVSVKFISKINGSCIGTQTIDFQVNTLPVIDRIDTNISVCTNLQPVTIGVASKDSRTYTYTWTRNGTAFAPTITGIDSSILIGLGGEYIVTATTKDGTSCSKSLTIQIKESSIATVEKKDIVVTGLNAGPNNTITIKTETLGIGDYEYAIDDKTGPYQDEPVFENIRPGLHTIYIRDKNECGVAKIDVSVIGYKKFFTPNGDGIHDTWNIIGLSKINQPNTKIYIFDRFGKLLKELDPLSSGWDGTFIGKPMPSTDYWFRVYLEDGREFKSHFSLVRPW